jgi:GT2 family glycosyltransferase
MRRRQVVLLGMISKIPVSGVVWQALHYLVGLERLGFETYYVEAHARTPSMFMELPDDDGAGRAAAFLAGVLERFGFGDRWAYHALHADGRVYGLSALQLDALYRSADLIINLHGGTEPRAEHVATDRLVYLETDPVEVEVQLAGGRAETVEYLRPHCAHFTYAENYGRAGCGLPVSPMFDLRPTRQPVVLDFWSRADATQGGRYTTVGNWRQQWRDVRLHGQTYSWSKDLEFFKFVDLPARTKASFDLALAGCEGDDRRRLEENGWRVRDARPYSENIDIYRHFITTSRAEFTVAKDQNVRLKTGWFSDRSATYLAAGRPVITQDTGFGAVLPTGQGLFAFSTEEEAAAAVDAIECDYARHSLAASEIAREFFSSERVLGSLLERVGLPRIPPGLSVSVVSRRPTTLAAETVKTVIETPMPVSLAAASDAPETSVVVVTHNGRVFARLCLESILGSRGTGEMEVIVVDNASVDGTLNYLDRLAARDPRLRVIANEENAGFARGVNQGLAAARGARFVVVNHDTIVPPESLGRLTSYLDDPAIGLVGPVSNRASTEAEIDLGYTTYGELMSAAGERAAAYAARLVDLPMLTMFCVALRRDVHEVVGPVDERFGPGLFEDDDYSRRVRDAGYRVVCAEDVFVHHFGEASVGALVPTGEHAAIFEENRRRFEEKWATTWTSHSRRPDARYEETIEKIRETVQASVPTGSHVLVVSKGDDALLDFDGRLGEHFPQLDGGVYAGHHPADSDEAITALEAQRLAGAQYLVIPTPSMWWLDHYSGFREHLGRSCREVAHRDDACVIFELEARR